jgi:hypothetical protein
MQSRRKALLGASEESPILPAGTALAGPETGLFRAYLGLSTPQPT